MDEQFLQPREGEHMPMRDAHLDEGQQALIDELGVIEELSSRPHAESVKPLPLSAYDIDVVRDDANLKYDAVLNDHAIGQLAYTYVSGGKRIALLGTSVSAAYRQRGVATEFISRVLDDVRLSGRTVTVICPVIRSFIDKSPQYEDLVDRAHPGVASVDVTLAHSMKET